MGVVEKARATVRAVEARGLAVPVVTGAGTGTYPFEAGSGVYTEIQPGSYVFHDADYAKNPDSTWEHSLFVLAQVMSVNPEGGWCVVDAGLKSHSVDTGVPVLHGRPDVECVNGGDEHLIVRGAAEGGRDGAYGGVALLPVFLLLPSFSMCSLLPHHHCARRSSSSHPASGCRSWAPSCVWCPTTATRRAICTPGWWLCEGELWRKFGPSTGARATEARRWAGVCVGRGARAGLVGSARAVPASHERLRHVQRRSPWRPVRRARACGHAAGDGLSVSHPPGTAGAATEAESRVARHLHRSQRLAWRKAGSRAVVAARARHPDAVRARAVRVERVLREEWGDKHGRHVPREAGQRIRVDGHLRLVRVVPQQLVHAGALQPTATAEGTHGSTSVRSGGGARAPPRTASAAMP